MLEGHSKGYLRIICFKMLIKIEKLKKKYKGDDKVRLLDRFLSELSSELEVGLFSEDKEPDGTPVSIVGRKQEFGGLGSGWGEETKAPKNNPYGGFELKVGIIPPRPFMRPAIAKNGDKWIGQLKKEIRSTLDNIGRSKIDIEPTLRELGNAIVSDIRKSIDAVNSPKLSPITLKLRRNSGNYSTKPLKDSGTMYNSVKFKIRRNKQ